MTLLITRQDYANNKRQVTQSNIDTGALEQAGLDAQFVDVQKLLGSEFYNDLVRNSTNTVYQTLLNGGEYLSSGITYTNVGLKSVIVFYGYARYVLFGSVQDTPFSFINKETNDSSRVEFSEKKNIAKNNENIAFNYWESVRAFLDRNSNDYPLWNDIDCRIRRRNTGFKITKIG